MGLWDRLLGKKNSADDQQQVAIVQEICIAMIRLIPEGWKGAYLILDVPEHGLGRGLSHSPITPQLEKDGMVRGANFVFPDEAVMAATRKLELFWHQRNKSFKRAIISAVDLGDDWQIKSDYEYD